MTYQPTGIAPSQLELDRALVSADSADILVDGEVIGQCDSTQLFDLKSILSLASGGQYKAYSDPPNCVVIQLSKGGAATARLLIYPDLAIRLETFAHASLVNSPRSLATFLSARGCPGPLQVLTFLESTAAKERESNIQALAPESIRSHLPMLVRDPWAFDTAVYQSAFNALTTSTGDATSAFLRLCVWHGAIAAPWDPCLTDPPVIGMPSGPKLRIEQATDGLMRMFGVHEAIGLAGEECPVDARAGLCRFLVDNVQSRGFNLTGRIAANRREQLVASVSTQPENERRARLLLLDEGPIVPLGTSLFALSNAGQFSRICADNEHVVAVDGHQVVGFQGGERTVLSPIVRPGTPLALRKGQVWFYQPGGIRSTPVAGGRVSDHWAPFFGLPEKKLARAIQDQKYLVEETAEKWLGGRSALRSIPLDPNACEAYAAFGGDLPAALASPVQFATDKQGRILYRFGKRGSPVKVDLEGRAIALAVYTGGVVAVVEQENNNLCAIRTDGEHSTQLARFAAPSRRVKGVLPFGEKALIRLRAPLGEIVVMVG
ncbi:MAG: hypothetical protein IPK82_29105 [Polyangiaceae bacterium]|nr:hypothetical protein [Polyangiaceae bacterium]